MGLMDAFTAEDRITLKVSELWDMLYASAKIKAEGETIRKMLLMKEDKLPLFSRSQIEQFICSAEVKNDN